MFVGRSVISICLILVTVLQTTVPCSANYCFRGDRTTDCRERTAVGNNSTTTAERTSGSHLHSEDGPYRLPACPFCSGNVVVSKRALLDYGRQSNLDMLHRCLTSAGLSLRQDCLAGSLSTSTDRIFSDNVALTGRLLL